MSLGFRFFVVEGDEISPISQKVFQRFYFRREPALHQFAGRIIEVATVIYTLERRKPKEIVRIDCSRCRVNADGSIDKDYGREAQMCKIEQALGLGIAPADEEGTDSETSNVVKASARFASKWSPKLTGPAHKRILDFLFR